MGKFNNSTKKKKNDLNEITEYRHGKNETSIMTNRIKQREGRQNTPKPFNGNNYLIA